MKKIGDIINKEVFDGEDRRVIHNNEPMRWLFLVSGLMKSTPQKILMELDLKTWEQRANVGIIERYEYDLIVQAEKGGKCDACGKPWKREEIKINGKIITWVYRPSCTCYPRCIYCQRYLIMETKERMASCRYCGEVTCTRIVANRKRTPDGEWIEGKGRSSCTGIMELKLLNHGGNTVYECNKCGYTIKRKIIV